MTTPSPVRRMTFRRLTSVCFTLSTLVALAACGGGSSSSSMDADEPAVADTPYESLPTFKAADLLPADVLEGDNYKISETVVNDGYENRFTIISDYGTFEAHRTDYVEERVREVAALEELGEVTRSDAFAQGVAQAATSPFRALRSLATEPVGTVAGVFQGVGALFSQAGEMATGSRGELEGSAAQELVGFAEVKREVANLLSVDPYTTNQLVQDGMNDVSWAGFAGGLSLAPLTAQVGGGAGAALSGLQNSKTLNSLVTSESPEALRDFNRERMDGMGIDEDLTEDFLQQPWLSPRHETVITAAMLGMDDAENRDAVFAQALYSQSEQQSVFLMRLAEAALGLHQNEVSVTRVESANRQVLFYTSDGRAICIMPADHLVWGQGASVIAEQSAEEGTPMELWLTGSISTMAEQEFSRRGWRVVSGAADRLVPNLDQGLPSEDEMSEDEGQTASAKP